jgi:ferric-dicitrate binding protein FerR (iron transport regulator)
MAGPPTLDCERARAMASLAIDSEASELEHVALAAHLRACDDCARFHREAWHITTAVRAVPLEAAPRSLWAAREPGRRRRGLGLAAAVAMSLAVAGGMGAAVARMGHSARPQHSQPAIVVAQRPPFSLARELLVYRTEHGWHAPAQTRWPRSRLII